MKPKRCRHGALLVNPLLIIVASVVAPQSATPKPADINMIGHAWPRRPSVGYEANQSHRDKPKQTLKGATHTNMDKQGLAIDRMAPHKVRVSARQPSVQDDKRAEAKPMSNKRSFWPRMVTKSLWKPRASQRNRIAWLRIQRRRAIPQQRQRDKASASSVCSVKKPWDGMRRTKHGAAERCRASRQ